jgi:hypothetical protein
MMAIQNVAAMSLLTFCPPEIGFRPQRLALIQSNKRVGNWVLVRKTYCHPSPEVNSEFRVQVGLWAESGA